MNGQPTGRMNGRPAQSGARRPPPLDPVDQVLLRLLREDGRAPVSSLAAAAHVSRATAYQRLERLRRDGTIQGFSARVDPARVGLSVTALVLLSAGPQMSVDWRPLRAKLMRMPQVEYAAFITGEQDVFLLVRVADQEEFRHFVLEELPALPQIRSTLSLLVLDEVVHRPYMLPGDQGSDGWGAATVT
jgi:Lrp/AsnC family leucine-responsive transcriptional regulator